MIRLDKYLSDMGAGTRSEVKAFIRQERVLVNGTVCRTPEQKVDSEQDEIVLHGQRLTYQKFYYYMLNKPAGVVTAREDSRDKTVMDVLQEHGLSCPAFRALSPVGRLDKDTEGLLLITNDGALSHRLLAPSRHVTKLYYARIKGTMTKEDQDCFAAGIELSDFTTLPANLNILRTEAGESEVQIALQEGKFHQVKRMVQAVGKEVIYLKRLSMGRLTLDQALAPGEWRELTEEEKEGLGC